MLNPQYFNQIKKGSTVTMCNGSYRVQEDRGHLHVVMKINGKRIKKTITPDLFCEPGSKADYVLNNWFTFYEWDEFQSFAAAEIEWLKY
jgi:hypothetical protein